MDTYKRVDIVCVWGGCGRGYRGINGNGKNTIKKIKVYLKNK